MAIRPENLGAIALLDEWFSEPDDMGEEFWLEHEEQMNMLRKLNFDANKIVIEPDNDIQP